MFFLVSSLILSIFFSNLITPSLPPEDGFFTLPEKVKEVNVSKFFDPFFIKVKGISRASEVKITKEDSHKEIKPKKIAKGYPEIEADYAVLFDEENERALFNKKANKKNSIASLTKLMTALVFLDRDPDWDSYYKITEKDRREGGRIYLFLGEEVKIKDIFNTSLVASGNTATVALVHSTGLTEKEFVQKMNGKADEIGLSNTNFKDVTGLSDENVSNSWEMAKIAKEALANKKIIKAVKKDEYKFKTKGGREKYVDSTDLLLEEYPANGVKMIGGKTGYTEDAGYCFVGKFEKEGNEIISVVLSADSKKSRFELTKKLVDWGYDSYEW